MRNKIAMSGIKYGRLTVISENGKYVECKCDCGNIITALSNNVKRGNTNSCGCYKKELSRNRLIKHGDARSVECRAWESMKRRCYNKNYYLYHRYGGRGITVCDEWRNDYSQFLKDMGRKPKGTIRYSLDRIDNNKGYSPDNCKWSTDSEQNKNRDPFERRRGMARY